MDRQWQLQDAKAHFSQVVDCALHGEPQHITRRGRAAVVVLAEEEYRRLLQAARSPAAGFIEHLLNIPGDGPDIERVAIAPREIDFE